MESQRETEEEGTERGRAEALTVLTLASNEASDEGRFTKQFCRCTREISAAVDCAFLRGAIAACFYLGGVCLCMCGMRLRFQGCSIPKGGGSIINNAPLPLPLRLWHVPRQARKPEGERAQNAPGAAGNSVPQFTVAAALSCDTQQRPDTACLITPARPATRRAKKRVCMPLETRPPVSA